MEFSYQQQTLWTSSSALLGKKAGLKLAVIWDFIDLLCLSVGTWVFPSLCFSSPFWLMGGDVGFVWKHAKKRRQRNYSWRKTEFKLDSHGFKEWISDWSAYCHKVVSLMQMNFIVSADTRPATFFLKCAKGVCSCSQQSYSWVYPAVLWL